MSSRQKKRANDYAGNYIYENGKLQFFNTPEGYVMPKDVNDYSAGFEYVYSYKDHLGNVRLSYTDADGNGSIDPANEIVKESNYYPFGLSHQGYNNNVSPLGNSAAKRYMFGGKELDESFNGTLNTYDFGARNYDPALGRWMNLDPLAEKTMQPYSYANNNPVYYTDPTGMIAEPFDEYDQDGNKISNLGGDKIDFFHQSNGDTKIVDRESGTSNMITGGEALIRGYSHRNKNTSWGKLFYEFDQGEGPEYSLISDFDDTEIGVFGSMNKTNSTYASKARSESVSSNNPSGLLTFDYSETNPLTAGLDGWEQFLGRTNISYYKLGDKVLYLMHDSKSWKSVSYRLGDSWDRESFKLNGTTTQTYIWTESSSEVRGKANAAQQQVDRRYQRILRESQSTSGFKF